MKICSILCLFLTVRAQKNEENKPEEDPLIERLEKIERKVIAWNDRNGLISKWSDWFSNLTRQRLIMVSVSILPLKLDRVTYKRNNMDKFEILEYFFLTFSHKHSKILISRAKMIYSKLFAKKFVQCNWHSC